ncbi:MAG: hypothetical protein OEV87_08515 [Phycisphaerae bacterium]|nr:hypothetical protein [Phycisphaerae bacterium]
MTGPGIKSICQKSMIYYYDYLSKKKGLVPDDISSHIAECAYCQQELHAIQQIDLESDTAAFTSEQTSHLELHFALAYQPIKCSTVKAFLPVMAIPEQQVTIPTPVTTHINYCTPCREELKRLIEMDLSVLQYGYVSQMFSDHTVSNAGNFSPSQIKAITEMLERPDSGIITCFRLKDPLKNEAGETFEVEVSTEKVPHTVTPQLSQIAAPEKSHTPAPNRRWLLRPMAAAAILMIATLLLFQSPSLQATDIGQIYEALKNVTHIAMTQYDADTAAPTQQTWVSRSLGVKLAKTADSFTRWNIANKTQEIHDSRTPQIQSVTLTPAAIEAIAKTMEAPYGLLPFKNASELPPGAVWEKVQPPQNRPESETTEVYNLFWTQKSTVGDIMGYRWQCSADPVTKQPFKVKLWEKHPAAQDYELTTVIEITYPTQAQMQDILAQPGLD